MAAWEIQRLHRGHERSQFDCGNAALNDWLRERAGQFDRKDLARTYVAVRPNESFALGYYALSSHRVVHEALPAAAAKGLPKIDVPVVLLGRLAVDRSVQGQGLGAFLMIDALRRTEQLSEQLGIRGIEVDAADEAARKFYLKFGFSPLLDDAPHLFLSIHIIRKLKLPPY